MYQKFMNECGKNECKIVYVSLENMASLSYVLFYERYEFNKKQLIAKKL
jgi:hypothetical protein